MVFNSRVVAVFMLLRLPKIFGSSILYKAGVVCSPRPYLQRTMRRVGSHLLKLKHFDKPRSYRLLQLRPEINTQWPAELNPPI